MKSPEFYHLVAAGALAATACDQQLEQSRDLQYNLHFDGYRAACKEIIQQETVEQRHCIGESPNKSVVFNPHRLIGQQTRQNILDVLNCVYAPLKNVKFSTEDSYYDVHNIYYAGEAHNLTPLNSNDRAFLMGSTLTYSDQKGAFDHVFIADSFRNERNKTSAFNAYELSHTTAHEIGHSLGLQHNDFAGLMWGVRGSFSYTGTPYHKTVSEPFSWNFSESEAAKILKKTGNDVTLEAVHALTHIDSRCAPVLESVRNKK